MEPRLILHPWRGTKPCETSWCICYAIFMPALTFNHVLRMDLNAGTRFWIILCSETTVHFDTKNPITLWDWNGTFTRSASFYAKPAWHKFDIFMNWYHSELSTILGSNMNVQCGIDCGHMFYVSMYASKKTQQEED